MPFRHAALSASRRPSEPVRSTSVPAPRMPRIVGTGTGAQPPQTFATDRRIVSRHTDSRYSAHRIRALRPVLRRSFPTGSRLTHGGPHGRAQSAIPRKRNKNGSSGMYFRHPRTAYSESLPDRSTHKKRVSATCQTPSSRTGYDRSTEPESAGAVRCICCTSPSSPPRRAGGS